MGPPTYLYDNHCLGLKVPDGKKINKSALQPVYMKIRNRKRIGIARDTQARRQTQPSGTGPRTTANTTEAHCHLCGISELLGAWDIYYLALDVHVIIGQRPHLPQASVLAPNVYGHPTAQP